MAIRECRLCGKTLKEVASNTLYCQECKEYIAQNRERQSRSWRRMNQNCHDCRFFEAQCCSYIFIMGHRRPCEFGDKCTVKEKKC